jgi:hypothetical protein
LAQRHVRYRDLSARIIRELQSGATVYAWTADELMRDDLVDGLGLGLGAAIYVGHGRPIGWVGYRGVRSHHLDTLGKPIGVMLSLTCLTASRRRTGLSFAEALPLRGAAAASFGAVGPTDHLDNSRWALRLTRVIAERPRLTIGELVVAAYPDSPASRGYRILGDPLAPLIDASGLEHRLRVFTERTAPPVEGGD